MFARDVKNACMHVYERCNKHMHACLQEMFAMGHSSESRLNSTLVSAQILIYKIFPEIYDTRYKDSSVLSTVMQVF